MRLIRVADRDVRTPRELLSAVAHMRGESTEEAVTEFLSPAPPIRNNISRLPGYEAARERLVAALRQREAIVIFGDYDCDGVTALVQLHDLLRAAGHGPLHWFIPDRMVDDYGLSLGAMEKCWEKFSPKLMITVDCGSPSQKAIAELRARGCDSIVIDHHMVELGAEHPALAHLNPKAYVPATGEPEAWLEEMADMSAAGLVMLFCEQIAKDTELEDCWDRSRSLLLSGIGTLVDVMPLRRINRALVKHSLRLANDPAVLASVPGLLALHELCSGQGGPHTVTSRTISFGWGPRLNASGRLEDAALAVNLLMERDSRAARDLARACEERNAERQALQRSVEREASAQAETLLKQEPNSQVLLLAGENWHCGVVGIVAANLKERYGRPAIVCGWHEDGYWKGSGRSTQVYDLGGAVREALEHGLLLKGGGHAAAAGLAISREKISDLRNWLCKRSALHAEDFLPQYEVLADVDGTHTPAVEDLAKRWCELYSRLEPFGSGNPMPLLALSDVELVWGPEPKKRRDSNVPWAYRAGFKWSGDGLLFAEWADCKRAEKEWKIGERYDLVVSVTQSRSSANASGTTRTYYNWRVRDCAAAGCTTV